MKYFIIVLSWIFLVASIFLFGYDALYFLKEGGILISIISALDICGLEWADTPRFWLGFHNILENIPFWLFIVLITLVLFYIKIKLFPNNVGLRNPSKGIL